MIGTQAKFNRLLKVVGVTVCLWLGFAILYVVSERVNEPTPYGLLSLVAVSVTVTMISHTLLRPAGGIGIDITRPLSLYGVFYFLYYLLPYLVLFYSGLIPAHNELTISVLLLTGWVACYLGVKASRVNIENTISFSWMEKPDAHILLGLCLGAICLIAYVYVWRDAEGIFYNQARYYEQERSVASSLRDVFGLSLQLPVLLILALTSAVSHRAVARISRLLFAAYTVAVFLLMILTSQTRLAVTVLVFAIIAIKLYRTFVVRPWQILVMSTVGIAAILLIQGVRITGREELAASQSQFTFTVENTVALGYLGVNDSREVVSNNLTQRSGASIMFMSDIIDATNDHYLYGQGLIQILPSIVPRFLWPDKPSILSPQVEYEKLLGLEVNDAPLGPINQFYAEGGAVAVFLGYLVFGWLLGKLSALTFSTPRVMVLLVFFFVWSMIAQMENELIVSTLVVIRNALFLYLAYFVLRLPLKFASSWSGRSRRWNLPTATKPGVS